MSGVVNALEPDDLVGEVQSRDQLRMRNSRAIYYDVNSFYRQQRHHEAAGPAVFRIDPGAAQED